MKQYINYVLVLILLTVSLPTLAKRDARYLLEQSFKTTNGFARNHYRRLLAVNHPNTAEGLFAKGYFSSEAEDRKQYYLAAIAKDKTLAVAYNNLVPNDLLSEQEKETYREKAVKYSRNTSDVLADYYLLTYYQNNKKFTSLIENDKALKKELLANNNLAENRAYWLIKSSNTEDKQLKFDYLSQAADQYGYSKELMKRQFTALRNLAKVKRQDGNTTFKQMLAIVYAIEEQSEFNPNDVFLAELAWLELFNYATKISDNRRDRFSIAMKAWAPRNSVNAYSVLSRSLREMGDHEAYRQLAEKMLVSEPEFNEAYAALGWYKSAIQKDSASAYNLLLKAIEYTYQGRRGNYYNDLTITALKHNDALPVIDLLENFYKKTEDTSAVYYLIELYLYQQNFQQALVYSKILDDAGLTGHWVDKFLAEMGEQDFRSESNYIKKNPFLARWDKLFGKQLSLSFEFPVNSAVIPNSAYSSLDKAAQALTATGSDNFVFRIEGHTDSSGGNKINIPLSKKRADAVKKYFVTNFNIKPGRLVTEGYGDSQPIQPNLTKVGKRKNRRVEIEPFGNTANPSVATVGYLDSRSTTFSKDGRYAAAGQDPITLWDLNIGAKIKELSFGGNKRSFSPNGRFFAVETNSTSSRGLAIKAVFISDTKTGLLRSVLPMRQSISVISWSPDSKRLAFTSGHGLLHVFDIEENKMVFSAPLSGREISGPVLWDKHNRYVFVSQAQSDEVHVFSAQDYSLVKVIKGTEWSHALGQSDDGQWLVSTNNDRSISHFDINTLSFTGKYPLKTRIADNILAIPGTNKLLFDDKFVDRAVSIYDIDTQQVTNAIGFDNEIRIGISPDGNEILYASDNEMGLLDINLTPKRVIAKSVSARGKNILFWDRSQDIALLEDDAGLTVWDVAKAKVIHRVDLAHTGWKRRAKDSKEWWTVSKEKEIVAFSLEQFKIMVKGRVNFQPMRNALSGDYFVISEAEVIKRETAKVAIYSISADEIIYIDVPLVTGVLQYNLLDAKIAAIKADAKNNLLLLFTYWNDGNYNHVYASQIQRYRLSDGKSAGEDILTSNPISGIWFEDEQLKVLTGTYKQSRDINTGEWLSSEKRSWNSAKDDDKTLDWGSYRLSYNGNNITTKAKIIDVKIDASKNIALVYYTDNSLEYRDLTSLSSHAKVFFKTNNQWIASTNQGYFTSSINGTDQTFWMLGDNYLPFSALSERFENPRKVNQTITALFAGEIKDDIDPFIEPDFVEAPFTVKLISSAAKQTKDDHYKMRIRIKKDDKNADDPTIHYLINGRKTRGFDSDPFADIEETLTYVRTLPLGEGSNKIEAIVSYKGVEVHKESINIFRTIEKTALAKNNLWFFGVGVSEYQKVTQNLDFADRDALELEKAFKAQEGKLFNKIHTKVLVNDNATARDIKIALYEFLSQAKEEDNIVIFIAGHGIQDTNQALYFMANDGDMSRPYTGLAMDEFKHFLDQRPINQKALFLMDICHSGAYGDSKVGTLTAEDVIKKISNGTATTVFSSSTGAQQSLEGEMFGGGHGAFTHVVLKAINGSADSEVGNKDGLVSLMEMIFYTVREVAEVTQKAQTPTVPAMTQFTDYPLSASGSE